jgi:hypothetical protein
MTSRLPRKKRNASHHAMVVVGGFNLSLRKSKILREAIGRTPDPPVWCTDYLGGRNIGGYSKSIFEKNKSR